jgi:dTDP-4-dehydrorhamnose reductase
MQMLALVRTGEIAQAIVVFARQHPDTVVVSLGRPQRDLLDTSSITARQAKRRLASAKLEEAVGVSIFDWQSGKARFVEQCLAAEVI